MRPVSDSFLRACANSHTVASRVDVLQSRTTAIEGVPVIGEATNAVTLDRTAEIRGRCSITLGWGRDARDALTPFGAELQVWSGVHLSRGAELVSLGIFGIQDAKVSPDGSQITITGLDRAQLVKDADFESTYIVHAGDNVALAIQALINQGVPGLQYKFADTDALTPLLVFDADTAGARWAAALQLAASIGWDLYFDGDGAVVGEPVPDPRADPVVDLHDGEGGVVVNAAPAYSRTPAVNKAIAYSQNPNPGSNPVRAVAIDDDPTSPTYYYGPFGKKPRRYPGPYTSLNQATTAANAYLRAGAGVAQTLDLSVAPNPALEPGDIASIRRRATDVDEVDVLDSIVVDIGVGAMSCGTRARVIR